MTDLGISGGWNSVTVSVNGRGEVAGAAQAGTGAFHPVVWRHDGEMTRLDEPSDQGVIYRHNMALGIRINEDGSLCGIRPKNGNGFGAAVWDTKNKRTYIGDIASDASKDLHFNASGQAAYMGIGSDSYGDVTSGYKWVLGVHHKLEGAKRIVGISEAGSVLANNKPGTLPACFLYTNTKRIILDDLLPPGWTFGGGGLFALNHKNEAAVVAFLHGKRHLIVLRLHGI